MTESIKTLSDKIDTLGTNVEAGFAGIQTEIDTLKAQIAAGTPVTQEDLDALGAKLDTVSQDILTKESEVK